MNKISSRFNWRLWRPGALLVRRPEIGVTWIIIAAAIYFAALFNTAFVRFVASATGKQGVDLAHLLGVALILVTGLHIILLGLVGWRWTIKPVLLVLLPASAAAAYYSENYGVFFDASMIRNILKTDTAEAGELMTLGFIGTVLLKSLPAMLLLAWIRIKRDGGVAAVALKRVALLVMALAISAGAALTQFDDLSSLMRNNKSARYLITPGNFIISSIRAFEEDRRVPRGPLQKVAEDAMLADHPPGSKPHFLVVVVGETVRAQNWGLNGYGRQTTPQLAKRNVINFVDVTACGSNTEVSVPCMFSPYGRGNYDRDRIKGSESLLHVLERASVKTLWRDNQSGCKGVCADLAFESYRAPPKDPLCSDQACKDEIMLNGLHDAIDDNPGDVVVVLHQLGNHGPAYFKRYGEEFRTFTPDCRNADLGKCSRQEIVNAYDNAIVATDDFLAKTIDMLAADDTHDTAMIYVSDHGESLGEGNLYLHGLPYAIAPATQIKVPMVVWLSEGLQRDRGIDQACVEREAGKPISHDNLFHSVLGLMQVATKDRKDELNIFGRCEGTLENTGS
ncbi:phosphoethanolamine transferase [Stenotrophomonas lactitubi]|uniref:phosphoethanolamine transferase n=1 Tax=Stenotrophomonas lactitubi TaxID=2045214 RepID=UPI001FAEEA62|nr:phosphoethanolamine--lipid A transferase [Stenotrophomonas lactitubi]